MSGQTRIARVVPGPPQANFATFVFGAPQPTSSPRESYLRLHRTIRCACLEEARPGAFLFAAQTAGDPVGRLWLAATATPRAGTLGRHESVDLPIAPDAALSLRHVLFVVRLVKGRVRFSAIDLETPGGLHTRHGAQHLTESERPALLRTAGLAFFCVPTGPGTVLPADADAAWRLFEDAPKPKQQSIVDQFLNRHAGARGTLTLRIDQQALPLTVDDPMLERGVLLGRQERCDVIIPDKCVSRVHAVVLHIDGVPHLVDAGSSNGTWYRTGTRVKCARLEEGDVFTLGTTTVEWRSAQ